MKHILLGALLAASPLWAAAQKNNLFADGGVCLPGLKPGASVTYNRTVLKHLGVGGGVQGYYFEGMNSGALPNYKFLPAVYGDLRAYVPVKKSLVFATLDFGVNIYKGENITNPARSHNNGLFSGLGFGYCYRTNTKGAGPYMTLKMVSDTYNTSEYYAATNNTEHIVNMNSSIAVSVGYKF